MDFNFPPHTQTNKQINSNIASVYTVLRILTSKLYSMIFLAYKSISLNKTSLFLTTNPTNNGILFAFTYHRSDGFYLIRQKKMISYVNINFIRCNPFRLLLDIKSSSSENAPEPTARCDAELKTDISSIIFGKRILFYK